MRETIKIGMVLIKEHTLLPDALSAQSESYSPGWLSFTGLDGFAMDRKTHDAGWTFFYLAGESGAVVIGGEGQKTARKAVKRILDRMKSEKFNSLEITRIDFKTFWGAPYARVSFHLRNLQEGMFLSGNGRSQPWEDSPIVAA